jgi:hypothetical protein
METQTEAREQRPTVAETDRAARPGLVVAERHRSILHMERLRPRAF